MDVGLIGSEGIRALLDHALGMVDEHLKSIFGDDDQISYIREGSNAGTIGKKEYDVMLKHSPHCRTRTAARSPRQSGIVRFERVV